MYKSPWGVGPWAVGSRLDGPQIDWLTAFAFIRDAAADDEALLKAVPAAVSMSWRINISTN